MTTQKEITNETISTMVNELKHEDVFNLGAFEKDELIATIESAWNFFQKFYVSDMGGHSEYHIYDVLNRSFKIGNFAIDKVGTGAFKEINLFSLLEIYRCLALAAFIHDMFQSDHRKDHHVRAGGYVQLLMERIKDNSLNLYDYKWLQDYNLDMLEVVFQMVTEHRASYIGIYSNIMCEIFSTADRDELVLDTVIKRSYLFHFSQQEEKPELKNKIIRIKETEFSTDKLIHDLRENNWSDEDIYVFYHIIDKFSKDGYAFKNMKNKWLMNEYYKNELKNFWNEINMYILLPHLFYSKYHK